MQSLAGLGPRPMPTDAKILEDGKNPYPDGSIHLLDENSIDFPDGTNARNTGCIKLETLNLMRSGVKNLAVPTLVHPACQRAVLPRHRLDSV